MTIPKPRIFEYPKIAQDHVATALDADTWRFRQCDSDDTTSFGLHRDRALTSTDIDRPTHKNVAGARNLKIGTISADGNAFLLDDQFVTLQPGLDATNGFLVFSGNNGGYGEFADLSPDPFMCCPRRIGKFACAQHDAS